MNNYARCKVCGFIGREGEMKKVCPACGAPLAAFESYTYKMSEERLKILDSHIHPILVHFPQSLAFLSLVFIVIAWINQGGIGTDFMTAERIISTLLPVSVLIAMAAGALDASTRFKKRYGPYIKQKILLGVIFLLFSIVTAVFIHQGAFTMLDKASVLILSVVSFACSFMLVKKGGTLLDAKIIG